MTEDRRLRVVTMNVLGPADPGWGRRRVLVGDTLQGLDADVVALQEVPIGSSTWTSGSGRRRRPCPGARRRSWHWRRPVGPVSVAHHEPSWEFGAEAEREQQALRAARAVEEHVGSAHAVVLGDFDATPEAASMQFWRGLRSLGG